MKVFIAPTPGVLHGGWNIYTSGDDRAWSYRHPSCAFHSGGYASAGEARDAAFAAGLIDAPHWRVYVPGYPTPWEFATRAEAEAFIARPEWRGAKISPP